MSNSTRPNVVLVFTDNQQAATLGCYGNPEIQTPVLDQLGAEGIIFNKAYCPNSFCSPCRASTLTGLLPSQHGVHSWIDDRNMAEWPVGWHALNGLSTLPEIMQQNGYRTGLFGKYHLGTPTMPAPGWHSWVTMEDGHVRSFYNNKIFDNGEIYEQPGHSVDFFTQKALEFIAENDDEQPFFAYLPYPAPYGHWPATIEAGEHRFSHLYDDCPMDSVPREGLSASAVRGYDLIKDNSGKGLDFSLVMRAPNHLPTLRNYYSQITLIDDCVGQIINALEAQGIRENTLIIFTADHGLSLGHHGFWGHGGSTFPSNLHQAGHSIPLIVNHKGQVDAGQRSDLLTSNLDLFATLLDYLGLEHQDAVSQTNNPSRSLAGMFRGEALSDWGEDEVYSEQEETRVLRTPQWVYFRRFTGNSNEDLQDELYDVINDPAEATNLIADPEHQLVATELASRIDRFFAEHVTAEADMWNGGQPLQNSLRPWFWRGAWGEEWQPVYQYEP
ncbi:MAG: sulfatase family protein [Thiolinea sp.]